MALGPPVNEDRHAQVSRNGEPPAQSYRRVELSLRFEASSGSVLDAAFDATPPVGSWRDLYRRCYISGYYDSADFQRLRRGESVCLVDRLDRQDGAAAIVCKRSRPDTEPFLLRDEFGQRVAFGGELPRAWPAMWRLPQEWGGNVEPCADQLVGVCVQHRRKRLCELGGGVVVVSYDEVRWHGPQGDESPLSFHLGLEANLDCSARAADSQGPSREEEARWLRATRALLSALAKMVAAHHDFARARESKLHEYLRALGGGP